jgi:hypothetical protein
MITQQEAKDILLLKEVSDVQLLQVVRRYLFDTKQIDVGVIKRISNPIQAQLLQIVIQTINKYYYGV